MPKSKKSKPKPGLKRSGKTSRKSSKPRESVEARYLRNAGSMQSKADTRLIWRIARRAALLHAGSGASPRSKKVREDAKNLFFDLVVVNSYLPLDLARLLEAPDRDLAHDVFGINQHLNRELGTLQHEFLPRFRKKVALSGNEGAEEAE